MKALIGLGLVLTLIAGFLMIYGWYLHRQLFFGPFIALLLGVNFLLILKERVAVRRMAGDRS
ncbi:hypothetical protein [Halalkalibacterium halodurans]|uniref:hypothetical protein n=1 Tax=Halalkalibacterium halodurans TaxID=86665 RepID=UPI002AA9E806|nr:hypothetical protein [Halalkalibacterium halodurans]MDY7223385.1 hypothetical protein [Halalkalibacterium halodurans]MDY7242606.1 hypothetical protein [Halalkalibacterium halodurans]